MIVSQFGITTSDVLREREMAKTPAEIPKTVVDHAVDLVSAALQSAPFTGGLAKYLEEYYPSQQKRMVASLVECLKDHASRIEIIHCNLDRLACLINEIGIESLRTASEVKRSAFRAVLLNYASGKNTQEHTLDMLVQTLANLTELQLQLLRLGEGVPDGDAYKARYEGRRENVAEFFPDLPREVLLNAYLGLLERGLVRRPYRGTPRSTDKLTLWYLIHTEFAKLLIEWIRFP